jgi:hypothetical protein
VEAAVVVVRPEVVEQEEVLAEIYTQVLEH